MKLYAIGNFAVGGEYLVLENGCIAHAKSLNCCARIIRALALAAREHGEQVFVEPDPELVGESVFFNDPALDETPLWPRLKFEELKTPTQYFAHRWRASTRVGDNRIDAFYSYADRAPTDEREGVKLAAVAHVDRRAREEWQKLEAAREERERLGR